MPTLDIGVSDDFLRSLGRVTAYFSVLEDSIAFFLWSVLGRDQRLGQILTAELSFRALAALTTNVFRHRTDDPSLIGELDAIINRALAIEERRNVAIHSRYAGGRTLTTQLRMKTTAKKSKGIGQVFDDISITDLEALAQDMVVLNRDLMLFSGKGPADLMGREDH